MWILSPTQNLRALWVAGDSAACLARAADGSLLYCTFPSSFRVGAPQVARRPLLMQPAAAVKNVDCHRAELLANCVTCLAYECVARNAGRRARDAGMLGDEAAHRRLRPVAPVMRCTAALAAIYHLTGLDRWVTGQTARMRMSSAIEP